MRSISIYKSVIDDTIEALDEHAATLRALSQRIGTIDQQAAHSTEVIAHELWELRKELADTRHRPRPGEWFIQTGTHHEITELGGEPFRL